MASNANGEMRTYQQDGEPWVRGYFYIKKDELTPDTDNIVGVAVSDSEDGRVVLQLREDE